MFGVYGTHFFSFWFSCICYHKTHQHLIFLSLLFLTDSMEVRCDRVEMLYGAIKLKRSSPINVSTDTRRRGRSSKRLLFS